MTGNKNRVFVLRDAEDRISAVSLQPQDGFEPCQIVGDAEQVYAPLELLASSDLALVRVLEDLIDVLIDKELIRFTDLPQIAQQKLLDRRSIRSEMKGLDLLGDEFDDVL